MHAAPKSVAESGKTPTTKPAPRARRRPAATEAPAKAVTATKAAKPVPTPVRKAKSEPPAVKASVPPKPAAPAAPAKVVKATPPVAPKADKVDKPKKPKLVRDSFTIPKPEYTAIDDLKKRSAALGHPVKKSELLRAGLKALTAMGDDALRKALAAVPAIKTGRPAKA